MLADHASSIRFPRTDRTDRAQCSASDVLRWMGLADLAGRDTDAIRFSTRRVRARQALFHEGQPFESLYCVAAGSFKIARTDREGYEQVLGFALHGDVLGLDGLHDRAHGSSATAMEDSMLAVIPFRALVNGGHEVDALQQLLQHAVGTEVRERQRMLTLMAPASSEVRLARFLKHHAERQRSLGHSDRRLRLAMSRRDIASCLGVAHETVSRSLAALQAQGCIAVSQRDIEIVDPQRLHGIQRATRGVPRAAPLAQGASGGPGAACAASGQDAAIAA